MKGGVSKKNVVFPENLDTRLIAGIWHQTELRYICFPLLCYFGQQYKLSNFAFITCKMGIITLLANMMKFEFSSPSACPWDT